MTINNIRKALLVAGLFVLLAFLYLSWGRTLVNTNVSQEYLPPAITGLKLERELEGDAAFRTVRESHMGQIDTAEDAIIGYYQEGLTIWIAEYGDEDLASTETQRMKQAIMEYASGFSTPKRLQVGEQSVYRTEFRGIYHYFWTKGSLIFYIASGPLDSSEIKDLVQELNQRSI